MFPGLLRLPSVAFATLACLAFTTPRGTADTGVQDTLAALIASLGDDDYHRRETAAAELKALGPTAIDALLAAAETSGDLEVALRARWLVETIPFEMPHDPPEVVKLLSRFKRRDFDDRVQAMHRLLRVDDDAGIEPLARVTRLDPSTAASRVAAALLAREWRPDDPAWPAMRNRIDAGLGPSTRPAARFLSALVAFTGSDGGANHDATLAAAAAALGALRRPAADDAPALAGGDEGDERVVVGRTLRIFERCHARMLLAAGRRDAALAAATAMLDEALAADDTDRQVAECVDTLAWAVEAGLPEAVEAVLAVPELFQRRPLVAHAVALAEQARGREAAAAERFAAGFEAVVLDGFIERLQAAVMLAKWGRVEWATRSYDAILDDMDLPGAERALAATMYAELLHDLEREEEATRCLRRIFGDDEPADGKRERAPPLEQFGRDPRSARSRMHFFESCALAQRGDAAGRRAAVERALAIYPKDVDALIALHSLPDNTDEQQADAGRRIKAALAQLEEDIQAVPDDTAGYNEYAWLVANTEGDIEKATRYSKLSLVKSFDNASFLDTLAHCHAAAGRHEAAIRTQRLARRHEPHNRTIQRNLERFEKLASE
ncbi:MAG: hypothetical protein WCR51_08760 [Planctomycetia bacterium]